MMNKRTSTTCEGCENCAASATTNPIANVVSIESRIEQVYNQFIRSAREELLPELSILGGEGILEDIYQETAVIVIELMSRLPADAVPNQNEIYKEAETYLHEWIKSQVLQRCCGCGYSYSELIKIASRCDEECYDEGRDTAHFHNHGIVHNVHILGAGGIFLKF